MTDQNASRRTFDDVVQPDAEEPSGTPGESEPGSRRRAASWSLPVATLVLGLAGVAALCTAVLLPPADADGQVAQQTPDPGRSPVSVSGQPDQTTDASTRRETVPLADRADPDWVSEVAAATGIPERALAAYAGAAIAVGQTHPTCRLGWNTLAAIGLVESEHGSIDGGSIDDDGVASPEIVGPPLDGNGVDAIADTDGGELDGDTVWDRAVGPMQFIPSTWEAYAQDADGDGRADIHQIDDAALTAAVYLCDVGGDLSAPDRWIAAVTAYNPSVEYNNRVAEAAEAYGASA